MYLQLIITLYGSNDSPVSSLPVFVPYFGDSVVKNLPVNVGEPGSIPGLGRSPGEGNGHPTPVFLPGESHEQRSLEGYSP